MQSGFQYANTMSEHARGDVIIEILAEATKEVLEEINRLLPQLSTSASPLTFEQLNGICRDETFFVARVDGGIVGSLTLVMFRLPTGVRAWIEDVVVDDACRGRGIGRLLLEAAAEVSAAHNAKSLDLTSRPSREAANRLYQNVGFQQRETNVYRYAK
jgi:ribosomal protein S18 acetylase RimI-like enzyme